MIAENESPETVVAMEGRMLESPVSRIYNRLGG
jgi:hypothetical protein